MNRIVKRQGSKPPWIELLGGVWRLATLKTHSLFIHPAELESAQASFRASLLSSYTRSLLRTLLTSAFHDRASLAALAAADVTRLRDEGWQAREEAYHKEAVRQLNDLVRRMVGSQCLPECFRLLKTPAQNALAPPVVRRGLVTLDEELAVTYDQAGPIVVSELAKRRQEGWDKAKGVSEYDDEILGAGQGKAGGSQWKDAWTFGEVLRRFARGFTRMFEAPTDQSSRQTDRHG